jgi:hypothetical protein
VTDPLTDPHRVAAARRLLDEVGDPAAFDRLSALAARLVGAGHAKVTLFTEDDVALLAVRVHPQDRPRPAEAGPQRVPPGIRPAPDVHPEAGRG